jgi:hypothetical protein
MRPPRRGPAEALLEAVVISLIVSRNSLFSPERMARILVSDTGDAQAIRGHGTGDELPLAVERIERAALRGALSRRPLACTRQRSVASGHRVSDVALHLAQHPSRRLPYAGLHGPGKGASLDQGIDGGSLVSDAPHHLAEGSGARAAVRRRWRQASRAPPLASSVVSLDSTNPNLPPLL